MIAIINILTIIFWAFSLFIVKEYVQKKQILPSLMVLTQRYSILISLFLFIIFCIFSIFLQRYLKIDSYLLLLMTWSIILFSWLGLYQNSFFQSQKYFKSISVYQLINPILRITIGWWLIYIWCWVFGAVGWFLIPFALLIILQYIHIRKLIWIAPKVSKQEKELFITDIKKQKKQIFHYIAFACITWILTNIDILVAKSIFESQTAGIYAALSIMAKFLIFIWISIETVYYPQLVGEKVYNSVKIFKIGWLYLSMLVISIIWLLVVWKPILNFFKEGLWDYQLVLIPLLTYCAVISYINFITKTQTAFKNYSLNYILWIYIIVLFIILEFFTNSIIGMWNILAISSILLLGIIFWSEKILWKTE
jgi:O-antigen/teichoic acid export membrane protein